MGFCMQNTSISSVCSERLNTPAVHETFWQEWTKCYIELRLIILLCFERQTVWRDQVWLHQKQLDIYLGENTYKSCLEVEVICICRSWIEHWMWILIVNVLHGNVNFSQWGAVMGLRAKTWDITIAIISSLRTKPLITCCSQGPMDFTSH